MISRHNEPIATCNARQIAALVPMARLLESVGFRVNERTRRCACLLHGGSNPSAFSWSEDGRWHCFSCGCGGDKIALVRSIRGCAFRDAIEFLALLAGVQNRSRRLSRQDVGHAAVQLVRAEQAAWRIADEIGYLRRYYTDGLHRAERLQRRIGQELLGPGNWAAKESTWGRLVQLAPVCTFFFAAWHCIFDATPDALTRFALASPAGRRDAILEGNTP
jgi:hypothetical protein